MNENHVYYNAMLPELVHEIGKFLENDAQFISYFNEATGYALKPRNFRGKCTDFIASNYDIRSFSCIRVSNHECRLDFDCSILEVFITYGDLRSISSLRGSPIRNIQARVINDGLEAVRGAPLEVISLEQMAGSDLEPLRGAPLRKFDVRSPLYNLEPLCEARLEQIWLSQFDVPDGLEPLRGMPLRTVTLGNYRGSLDALQGAPIEFISAFSNNSSLDPLKGAPIKGIIMLLFNQSIEALRGAPLEEIVLTSYVGSLEPLFASHETIRMIKIRRFQGDAGPLAPILSRL